MLTRRMLVPAAMAAAVGVPVVSSSEFSGLTQSFFTSDPAAPAIDPLAPPEQPELLYMPVQSFSEILRFDIDPNWVVSRWPRISTAPGGDGLQGLRVTLVTGLNPWDVCGSLTYFFDAQHQLQRIQMSGMTGDPNALVQVLMSQFGFQAHSTTTAGLYTAQRSGQVIGLLRLDQAAVIDQENPNQRLTLLLEINRPGSNYALSSTTVSMATAQPY